MNGANKDNEVKYQVILAEVHHDYFDSRKNFNCVIISIGH